MTVLIVPALLILVSAWVLLLTFFRAPRKRIDRVYTGFGTASCWVGGTKLDVRGLENIRPGEAYVIVPNHESDWDPIALLAALKQLSVRFIAKNEVIRVPILGQAMLRSGNVRVERSNTQGDVERIRKEMAQRPLDVSIIFYAEGTRSKDGALHPFKKGAFVTAIAYGIPILPVGHGGAYRIWKKHRTIGA